MDGFKRQLLFIKKLYKQIQPINVKFKDLEMITLTPKIMIGIYMDGIIWKNQAKISKLLHTMLYPCAISYWIKLLNIKLILKKDSFGIKKWLKDSQKIMDCGWDMETF